MDFSLPCSDMYSQPTQVKETNKVFDIGKGVIEMEVNKAPPILKTGDQYMQRCEVLPGS